MFIWVVCFVNSAQYLNANAVPASLLAFDMPPFTRT